MLLLPLEVSVVQIPHSENHGRRYPSKTSSDIVASDYIRLLIGREGEYWDPGNKNIAESIHLGEIVSQDRCIAKFEPTNAPTYARFSGSPLFTSLTHVHVIPAAIPVREVRSKE